MKKGRLIYSRLQISAYLLLLSCLGSIVLFAVSSKMLHRNEFTALCAHQMLKIPLAMKISFKYQFADSGNVLLNRGNNEEQHTLPTTPTLQYIDHRRYNILTNQRRLWQVDYQIRTNVIALWTN